MGACSSNHKNTKAKTQADFKEFEVKTITFSPEDNDFPLPKDVLVTIFFYLPNADWRSGRLVCKLWYNFLVTMLEEIDNTQVITNKVQDRHIYFMYKRHPNLRKLDLYACYQLTDRSLTVISKLSQLRKLCLSYCSDLTDVGMAQLESLKNLQELQLSGCKITDATIFSVICKMSNLKLLMIGDCDGISNKGVIEISTKLLSLTSLFLFSCTLLKDEAFVNFFNLKELETLDLGRSLSYLSTLTHLKKLSLTYCPQITNDGMDHLVNLTSLQVLDLFGCSEVDSIGRNKLFHIQNLKFLK